MADHSPVTFSAVSAFNEPLPAVPEEQCARLWDAASVIGRIYRIEEVYGYVIESWLSFEDEVAFHKRRGLRWMNAKTDTRVFFFEARASIDVRLLTFLSASRMYLDQAKTAVAGMTQLSSDFRQQIQQARNLHRRKDHFFLIADELRNLMQHENLGLDRIRSGWESRSTHNAPDAWAPTLLPEIVNIGGIRKAIEQKQAAAAAAVARCASDKRAQKRHEQHGAEVALLATVATPINVQAYIKRFCAALSEIHASVREGLKSLEEESMAQYEDAIASHGNSLPSQPGLRIQQIDESGSPVDEVWVGRTLIERLGFLRKRYFGWERVRDLSH